MNELVKIFNMLVLYDYNIRVLHWKIVGKGFETNHNLMDSYHSQLNTMIDDIGECILMLKGNIPAFTEIPTYLRNDDSTSYVLLNGTDKYDSEKVLENTRKMFNGLLDAYQKATDNSEIPGDIVSKLQEHQYWLRKESNYKLDSKLQ